MSASHSTAASAGGSWRWDADVLFLRRWAACLRGLFQAWAAAAAPQRLDPWAAWAEGVAAAVRAWCGVVSEE